MLILRCEPVLGVTPQFWFWVLRQSHIGFLHPIPQNYNSNQQKVQTTSKFFPQRHETQHGHVAIGCRIFSSWTNAVRSDHIEWKQRTIKPKNLLPAISIKTRMWLYFPSKILSCLQQFGEPCLHLFSGALAKQTGGIFDACYTWHC